MGDVLVGLVLIVLGLGVCFAGYKVFVFLLPVWAFLVGFWAGGAAVSEVLGDRFLATVAGWLVGLVIGIVFAWLSYLYWYIAVTVLAASVGASIGAGLLRAFGVHSTAVLVIGGVIVAVAFAIAGILLELPKMLVIAYTAVAGATAAVAGLDLVLNRVDRQELWAGGLYAVVTDSWFWLIVTAIVAAIGLYAQIQTTAGFTADVRAARRISRSGAA